MICIFSFLHFIIDIDLDCRNLDNLKRCPAVGHLLFSQRDSNPHLIVIVKQFRIAVWKLPLHDHLIVNAAAPFPIPFFILFLLYCHLNLLFSFATLNLNRSFSFFQSFNCQLSFFQCNFYNFLIFLGKLYKAHS